MFNQIFFSSSITKMFISKIHLQDFRNYGDKSFEFTKNKIVFCGPNGKGKTNILEAISILSMGKSWRETSPSDLINELCTPENFSAKISGTVSSYDEYQTLILPRSRTFLKNDKKISRTQFFGQIPTLLFSPEFINLFSGTKTNRVQFFDRFLVQISPFYRENLLKATKAHKQKTKLLKQQELFNNHLDDQINIWNEILIQTIPQLHKEKIDLIKNLQPFLETSLKNISQKDEPIKLIIKQAEDIELTQSGISDFFEKNKAREIAAQKNFIATHRDDWSFVYRDKPILASASRGEERSILLALIDAQKQFLQQESNLTPILLLDDVFSELDAQRQAHLDKICQDGQVFFTTTHKDHFEKFEDIQIFEM